VLGPRRVRSLNWKVTVSGDRIFASPLGRAQETAAIAARKLGQTVTTMKWLQELPAHQLPMSDLVFWDIHGHQVRTTAYLDDPNNWRTITELAQLAEIDLDQLYKTLIEHSDAFLASLGYDREGPVYRVRQRNELKIAVVCHGGFGLTWMAHLLAIPLPLMWSSFFLHTTSVSTILFDERTPEIAVPRCIGLGEVAHLYHQQIAPGTSGIKANYY
jgi:probable phosphoglycerate mutase